MRALLLENYHDDLTTAIRGLKVVERPRPVPGPRQVLVRIEAAPCNPSDMLLLQGKYSLKTLPSVPGWEGAGTVVENGGGWLGWWLQGKRVACALKDDRDGTWAEFVVVSAMECIPLRRDVPIEQGASLIVNPLTAVGLLETARRRGHRAAVHTAGASQVGRMLLVLAAEARYPLINIVRRDEQVQLLKSHGAEHVLNSSDAAFADQLKTLCLRLGATIAFEAVAGAMTGTVIGAMPANSQVYLYGALSEEPCGNIDPIEIIFYQKSLRGFYLGAWAKQQGPLRMLRDARRVQKLIADGRLATKIQRRLSLDEAVEGLQHYTTHMTDGKVLIAPHAHH